MIRVVTSTSAASRLSAAGRFLDQTFPVARSARRRRVARRGRRSRARGRAGGAARPFGLTRFSADRARRARRGRGARGRRARARRPRPAAEALAARVVFDAAAAGELDVLHAGGRDARLSARARADAPRAAAGRGVAPHALARGGAARGDIGRLLARMEAQLERAGGGRPRGALRVSRRRVGGGRVALGRPARRAARRRRSTRAPSATFARGSCARASQALATVPDGDAASLEALDRERRAEIERRTTTRPAERSGASAPLRVHAPKAGRRARERPAMSACFRRRAKGAKRSRSSAACSTKRAAGVPFDEMAVFLRAPQQYLGLLEHACARAGVPVYFDRGTRRPDPAGRAFVALLSSAVEGLSAKRFDEYLSLGQVPRIGAAGRRPPPAPAARRGASASLCPTLDADEDPESPMPTPPPARFGRRRDRRGHAARAVEVGRADRRVAPSLAARAARTARRAGGAGSTALRTTTAIRLAELAARGARFAAPIARLERDLRNLAHLRAFALPIVDALADWPDAATWGEWLDRFSALAARALAAARPRAARARRSAADGGRRSGDARGSARRASRSARRARLGSAGAALRPRLRRARRIRRAGARSASCSCPGLAERIVPQRPREDPLLLDERRRAIDAGARCVRTSAAAPNACC